MFFRRRFSRSTRTRRPIRRRIFRRRGRQSLALRALRIAKRVDRRAERKYFNPTYTSALATTFNVFCPVEIIQGDTASQREGNQIDVQRIRLRMNFTTANASQNTGCLVRCVIVQALQQVADTAITGGQVFNNGASWNSVYNFPTSIGYFKVLYDNTFNVTPDTWSLDTAGTGFSINTETFRQVIINLKRKRMWYNGPAANDFQKNQVYVLLAKSNNSYVVTPDIQAQVAFIDS